MHRNFLKEKLKSYSKKFPYEETTKTFKNLLKNHSACFDRDFYTPGHITGSAWILNKQRTKTILHLHRKLNKWLQLGGHSDGNPLTDQVALKEAIEESGLKSLKLIDKEIFDLDLHTFPAKENNPEHFHFDVRFLFEADENEPFNPPAEESKQLAWIELDLITEYNNHPTFHRMVKKTNAYLTRVDLKSKLIDNNNKTN